MRHSNAPEQRPFRPMPFARMPFSEQMHGSGNGDAVQLNVEPAVNRKAGANARRPRKGRSERMNDGQGFRGS